MKKLIVVLLAAGLSAAALAEPAVVKDGALVDARGMSLYTFDKDEPGKSACNGKCAENWPPLLAGADGQAAGDWGIVVRDDGRRQWSFKGRPLYGWIKDEKPGDRSGDGFNGVWRLAR